MKVKIIEETAEGDFTVYSVYEVWSVNSGIKVLDNNDDIAQVYTGEFEWVEV